MVKLKEISEKRKKMLVSFEYSNEAMRMNKK